MTAVDDDVQAVEELAELSAQLPEDASLALYRMLDGAEKEFCDQMAVRDFSVAAVATRFGGGRYTIYLRKPDPERAGKWIRQGSKRFRVAGAPRTGADVAPASTALVASAGGDSALRGYGELIQATIRSSLDNQQLMQQMQMALMKTMMDRPADTSMDLMKSILPTLLTRGKGETPSISDVIALADRLASKTSPTSQLKESLDLLRTARELSGDGGDATPAPAWLTVAGRALDIFGRAYQPPALAPAEPAPLALPAGTPAPLPDTPAAPAGDTVHPLVTWLRPQLPGLIRHAEADHDPDTYAGVLVDQISPAHVGDVLAFLQGPLFMAQLAAAFPAVEPVRAWFDELRAAVVERLQELLHDDDAIADDAAADDAVPS